MFVTDTAFLYVLTCLFSVDLFRFALLSFSVQCLHCSEASFSDRIKLLLLSLDILALPLYFSSITDRLLPKIFILEY